MTSVFISYSSEDKPFVRELCNRLSAYPIKVWFDEGELNIGDKLLTSLSEATAEVDYLIAVISANSINSKWVGLELEMAFTDELESGIKKVLPVFIERVQIPTALRYLKRKVFCDLSDKTHFEEQFSKLLRAIGINVGISPTIHNLELFRFLDLVFKGDVMYIVASQKTGTGRYKQSSEGSIVYEVFLYLIRIEKSGSISSMLIAEHIAVEHVALAVGETALLVFYNFKEKDNTFAMSGSLNHFDLHSLGKKYSVELFRNRNWGWFPVILDKMTVHHYSFSNKHFCRNGKSVGPKDIPDEEATRPYYETRTGHSHSLLDKPQAEIASFIRSWMMSNQ